ncbi:MAG: 30S ribosomal protein S6e [Candidatus Micrarchaeia archaeon]
MKIVVSDPKTGKSYQTELPKGKEGLLVGMKIGSEIDGGVIGATGYKLRITGGTDKDGFPMLPSITGAGKQKVLLSKPPGFRPKREGERRRKTIRGNVISDATMQVNTVVLEYGPKPLEETIVIEKKEGKKEKEKKAEAGKKR